MVIGQMLPWAKGEVFQLGHLNNAVKRSTPSGYYNLIKNWRSMFYSYFQFRYYISSMQSTLMLERRPMKLEHVCVQGPFQQHFISSIYQFLNEASPLTEHFHL